MRGELDGSKLELVAKNFRNPYEVCVSSFGESYLSDNDNDGNHSVRICWLLEGGNYGWFGHPPGRVPREIPFANIGTFAGTAGLRARQARHRLRIAVRNLLLRRGCVGSAIQKARRCTPMPARAKSALSL